MKISIKHYLNKSLKPLDFEEDPIDNFKRVIGSIVSNKIYHPLYVRVRCDGQQAQLKSKYSYFVLNEEAILYGYSYKSSIKLDRMLESNTDYLTESELSSPDEVLALALSEESNFIEALVGQYKSRIEEEGYEFKLSHALRYYAMTGYMIRVQELVSEELNKTFSDYLKANSYEDLESILLNGLDFRYMAVRLKRILGPDYTNVISFLNELLEVFEIGNQALSNCLIWLPEYLYSGKIQSVMEEIIKSKTKYGEQAMTIWVDSLKAYETHMLFESDTYPMY